MSAVKTIPELHRFIKDQHKEVRERAQKNATMLASMQARGEAVAGAILRDTVEAEILRSASQDLVKVSAGANTDPLHRARTFKAVLQERLFEVTGSNMAGSPLVVATYAEQARALKHLIFEVDGLIRTLERAE